MQSPEATAPSTASDLALFLKSLAGEGHARVASGPLAYETDDALEALQQIDAIARAELALDLPRFSPAAALWAARLVYHLCQFTVCRDVDEARIDEVCGQSCPESRGAETDWSADLTLRHLPGIFRLARQLSGADPLVEQLRRIAHAWPLSSVGIPGLEKPRLDSFIQHPALCRLYVDRVLAAGDESRLGDARVDDALRAGLGIHHELAPALAGRLFTDTHDTA